MESGKERDHVELMSLLLPQTFSSFLLQREEERLKQEDKLISHIFLKQRQWLYFHLFAIDVWVVF